MTDGVMKLGLYYDSRQQWLPFIYAQYRLDEVLNTPIRDDWRNINDLKRSVLPHVMITPDKLERLMYMPVPGVDQPGLPFWEHQEVGTLEYEILHRMDWPGWEKVNDQPALIVTIGVDPNEMREWLQDCCKGRFCLRKTVLLLQCVKDYAMFLLRFAH